MQDPFPYTRPVDFLNRLRTVFYVMVGWPMFVFLAIYLTNRKHIYPVLLEEPPTWAMGALAVLCIAMTVYAYILYYGQLKQIRKLPQLREKLNTLYNLDIRKFWILEVATTLNLILYVLSAHTAMAGLYIVMLVGFAMSNPSYYNVVSDLKLPKAERDIMRQNQQIPS